MGLSVEITAAFNNFSATNLDFITLTRLLQVTRTNTYDNYINPASVGFNQQSAPSSVDQSISLFNSSSGLAVKRNLSSVQFNMIKVVYLLLAP